MSSIKVQMIDIICTEHVLTFSIFCPLFHKADIQAVEQCHDQSQVDAVQWAISLSCHCLQVANKSQGVIFTQRRLAGPWKQAVCQGLSGFFDEVRNLGTREGVKYCPYSSLYILPLHVSTSDTTESYWLWTSEVWQKTNILWKWLSRFQINTKSLLPPLSCASRCPGRAPSAAVQTHASHLSLTPRLGCVWSDPGSSGHL